MLNTVKKCIKQTTDVHEVYWCELKYSIITHHPHYKNNELGMNCAIDVEHLITMNNYKYNINNITPREEQSNMD